MGQKKILEHEAPTTISDDNRHVQNQQLALDAFQKAPMVKGWQEILKEIDPGSFEQHDVIEPMLKLASEKNLHQGLSQLFKLENGRYSIDNPIEFALFLSNNSALLKDERFGNAYYMLLKSTVDLQFKKYRDCCISIEQLASSIQQPSHTIDGLIKSIHNLREMGTWLCLLVKAGRGILELRDAMPVGGTREVQDLYDTVGHAVEQEISPMYRKISSTILDKFGNTWFNTALYKLEDIMEQSNKCTRGGMNSIDIVDWNKLQAAAFRHAEGNATMSGGMDKLHKLAIWQQHCTEGSAGNSSPNLLSQAISYGHNNSGDNAHQGQGAQRALEYSVANDDQWMSIHD